MTVRLTITPPPALSPWRTRKNSSVERSVERAQPTEASTKTVTPAIITGRRPSASESGPWNGLITPKAMRYALTTSWSSAAEAGRSRAHLGVRRERACRC